MFDFMLLDHLAFNEDLSRPLCDWNGLPFPLNLPDGFTTGVQTLSSFVGPNMLFSSSSSMFDLSLHEVIALLYKNASELHPRSIIDYLLSAVVNGNVRRGTTHVCARKSLT